MRIPRPDSLRALIITGTLLVATPLFIAVVHSTVQMRVLTQRSAALIASTDAAIHAGEQLVIASTTLERTVRLRLALSDPSLDDVVLENAQRTITALDSVGSPETSDERQDVDAIRSEITRLTTAVVEISARHAKPQDPLLEPAIDRLKDLATNVRRLNQHIAHQTVLSLEALQASTARAEARLYQELSVLLPITALLVVGFLAALSRPLRRIDRAIDALGRGRYEQPIVIKGPADLVKLGQQLEWLRLRLIDVAEAKNRFLRHMSHELKTPLASIREGTELLLEGAVGALHTEQREVVGILRDNGIKLQRNIENLLSYSSWEAQTVALNLEEFPLRDLVRAVIDAHRMTILAHRLRLTIEVSDLIVTADRSKLRLILDNLLSNAMKYTPLDGAIQIHAKADGSDLVMDIIDSGPGIAAEDRPHLFEAFYTGRASGTSPLPGTGIGLSVVLEFTEAQRGTIALLNEQDTGAHFRLRLPAYPKTAHRNGMLHEE